MNVTSIGEVKKNLLFHNFSPIVCKKEDFDTMAQKSDNFGWGVTCGLAIGIGIGALCTDEPSPEIQKARMEYRIAVAKAERKLPSLIRQFSAQAAERGCTTISDFNHEEGVKDSVDALLENLTTLETVQLLEFLQENNIHLREMDRFGGSPAAVYFNNATTNERVLAIRPDYAENSEYEDAIKDLSYSLQHVEDLSKDFSLVIPFEDPFNTTKLTKTDNTSPIKIDQFYSIHPCPQPK